MTLLRTGRSPLGAVIRSPLGARCRLTATQVYDCCLYGDCCFSSISKVRFPRPTLSINYGSYWWTAGSEVQRAATEDIVDNWNSASDPITLDWGHPSLPLLYCGYWHKYVPELSTPPSYTEVLFTYYHNSNYERVWNHSDSVDITTRMTVSNVTCCGADVSWSVIDRYDADGYGAGEGLIMTGSTTGKLEIVNNKCCRISSGGACLKVDPLDCGGLCAEEDI